MVLSILSILSKALSISNWTISLNGNNNNYCHSNCAKIQLSPIQSIGIFHIYIYAW